MEISEHIHTQFFYVEHNNIERNGITIIQHSDQSHTRYCPTRDAGVLILQSLSFCAVFRPTPGNVIAPWKLWISCIGVAWNFTFTLDAVGDSVDILNTFANRVWVVHIILYRTSDSIKKNDQRIMIDFRMSKRIPIASLQRAHYTVGEFPPTFAFRLHVSGLAVLEAFPMESCQLRLPFLAQ